MSEPGVYEARLSTLLASAGLKPLSEAQLSQFAVYLNLLLKWNARLNLTAIRDSDGILSRHFVECIACAQSLPLGITSLLDLGSGAGFPGVPIAICRPDIAITLAESQNKKSAFLQEVVRSLAISACVWCGRAESLQAQYDCVTLRAVDRMALAIQVAAERAKPGGWLAPMSTHADLPSLQVAVGPGFQWQDPIPLPASEDRVLALARMTSSAT
ncbi:MAG: 16S rRNA (guanine(527)-N(7))-methyltransferase RsmG [Acidobacteriota bacterium]|nr:16S rRNA (guanine(527)-N(7))-methyltransferase RsmG [Acidobacteriota bacterium]